MKKLNPVLIAVITLALTVGFFTTVASAEEYVKIEKIETSKPFLGVYPQGIDDDDREALDWKKDYGILINDVVSDGPAEKAGIKGGDILIKINDDEIKSLKSLHKVLTQYKPDDKVKAYVIRNGKKKDFKLVLGSMPEKDVQVMTIEKKYSNSGFLGVYSMELNDQLKTYFKVDHGVMIKSVSEETPASKAGIKAGDILMSVDDDQIETSGELMKALRSRKPETEVSIAIMREGKPMTLKAVLGAAPNQVKFPQFTGDFEIEDIDEIIHEAMENIEIQIETHGDFKEEMDELRKELKELKKELKEMKKKSK